jgi:hypothetical protein
MEQAQSWASAINADDVAMFIASVTKDNVNIRQNINGAFYTPVQYLAKYGNTNSHQMLDHLLFLGADLSLKADAAALPVNGLTYSDKYLIEGMMNKCKPLNNKACVKIGNLSLFNPNLNESHIEIMLDLLMYLDEGKYIPNENSQNKEIKTYKIESLQRIILSIFLFLCISTNIYSINYLKTNYEYKNLTNYFKDPKSAQLYKSKLDSELLNLNSKIFQIEIREVTLNLLVTQKRLDLALQVATEMTLDFPRRVNGWDATAKIYEFNNDFVSAKPYRLKTIELDPLNKNFQSRLKN